MYFIALPFVLIAFATLGPMWGFASIYVFGFLYCGYLSLTDTNYTRKADRESKKRTCHSARHGGHAVAGLSMIETEDVTRNAVGYRASSGRVGLLGDDLWMPSGINPATGLPMMGIVDVAGNVYGQNSQDDFRSVHHIDHDHTRFGVHDFDHSTSSFHNDHASARFDHGHSSFGHGSSSFGDY